MLLLPDDIVSNRVVGVVGGTVSGGGVYKNDYKS